MFRSPSITADFRGNLLCGGCNAGCVRAEGGRPTRPRKFLERTEQLQICLEIDIALAFVMPRAGGGTGISLSQPEQYLQLVYVTTVWFMLKSAGD